MTNNTVTKDKDSGKLDAKAAKIYNEFCEFVAEFKGESDRAAVILGASKIDQLLGMILEGYLTPCPTSRDDLFENNGPLGTFSSKINMCHRLTLINDEFCKTIHMIRKIRNSFAHEVYGASLESGSHKDRIKSLIAPFEKKDGPYKWLKNLHYKAEDGSRIDFSIALGLVIIRLEGVLHNIKPVSSKNACTLLPNA